MLRSFGDLSYQIPCRKTWNGTNTLPQLFKYSVLPGNPQLVNNLSHLLGQVGGFISFNVERKAVLARYKFR